MKKRTSDLEGKAKRDNEMVAKLKADIVSLKEEAKEWKEKYESSEQLRKTGTDKYNSLKNEVDTANSLLTSQLLEAEETGFLSNLEVSEVGVVEKWSEPRDGNASCSIQ